MRLRYRFGGSAWPEPILDALTGCPSRPVTRISTTEPVSGAAIDVSARHDVPMDWTPFVSTLLGGLLAAGGGFAGQWWSERRERAREERNREHEREIWARGLRYEAHVAFLSTFDAKYKSAQEASGRHDLGEVPDDWLVPVWDRLQALRMVCHDRTAKKAETALASLQAYTHGTGGRWEQVEWDLDRYLGAIREEFQLAPISLFGEDLPDVAGQS